MNRWRMPPNTRDNAGSQKVPSKIGLERGTGVVRVEQAQSLPRGGGRRLTVANTSTKAKSVDASSLGDIRDGSETDNSPDLDDAINQNQVKFGKEETRENGEDQTRRFIELADGERITYTGPRYRLKPNEQFEPPKDDNDDHSRQMSTTEIAKTPPEERGERVVVKTDRGFVTLYRGSDDQLYNSPAALRLRNARDEFSQGANTEDIPANGELGSGNHIIQDSTGSGTLKLNGSIRTAQLARSGNDLIADDGKSVFVLKDHFAEGGNKKTALEFNDGKLSDIGDEGITLTQKGSEKEFDIQIEPKFQIDTNRDSDGNTSSRISIGVGIGIKNLEVGVVGLLEGIKNLFFEDSDNSQKSKGTDHNNETGYGYGSRDANGDYDLDGIPNKDDNRDDSGDPSGGHDGAV